MGWNVPAESIYVNKKKWWERMLQRIESKKEVQIKITRNNASDIHVTKN